MSRGRRRTVVGRCLRRFDSADCYRWEDKIHLIPRLEAVAAAEIPAAGTGVAGAAILAVGADSAAAAAAVVAAVVPGHRHRLEADWQGYPNRSRGSPGPGRPSQNRSPCSERSDLKPTMRSGLGRWGCRGRLGLAGCAGWWDFRRCMKL